jgi:hypothetical protein
VIQASTSGALSVLPDNSAYMISNAQSVTFN